MPSHFYGYNHTTVARRCRYLKVVICFHIYQFGVSAVDISSAPLFRGGTTFAYFDSFWEIPSCRYGRAARWGYTTLPVIIPVNVSIQNTKESGPMGEVPQARLAKALL